MTDRAARANAVATRPDASPKQNGSKPRRRRTSHLKRVPEERRLRDELRTRCQQIARGLDKSNPLTKDQMEALSRQILADMDLPEGYVGWTMVLLASAFWQDQVAAVPPARRLFLLPHCLKHAEGCPADYDQFGLDCERCGACCIADFRTTAEAMGYKVLVAEGSPIVLKIIVSGYVDAIVGVACLNVLEKAIDKILAAGIPCMAVPLLSSDCRNTSVDEDWVREMIHVQTSAPVAQTRTYIHLMRSASRMFDADELEKLCPRSRGAINQMHGETFDSTSAVAATGAIAYDFLSRGGKYTRPFVTLAAYDALSGGHGTLSGGADHLAKTPAAVGQTALAIEAFHKASLVHDDIEDDDAFRYGQDTVHRKYGVPTAINVGDYLIGMGYRLIGDAAPSLGADVATDILARFADAHMRLSEGQGAELHWRDRADKMLTPLDALKIYALKTAPAFEAALYAGVRLAGDAAPHAEAIKQFAKHVGIAFQILNDLKDWQGDRVNNRRAGGDFLGGRPTVLWALACEGASEPDRLRLDEIVRSGSTDRAATDEARRIYEAAGAFEKAHRLVDKYQQRAEAVADEVDGDEFRRLLYYLIDTVLERPANDTPIVFSPALPTDVAVVAES